MLEFTKLDNGKLRLTLGDKNDLQEFKEMLEERGSNDTLITSTESYWTNGWGVTDSVGNFWQLSEAPAICEESTSEDDGSTTLSGKAWYYGDYMILCPMEQIIENGFVDFDFWQDFKIPVNFRVGLENRDTFLFSELDIYAKEQALTYEELRTGENCTTETMKNSKERFLDFGMNVKMSATKENNQ